MILKIYMRKSTTAVDSEGLQLKRNQCLYYTVAYLLRSRTVEPEKQLLLANGSGNDIRC
jgi:hypothetical protein